MRFIDRPEYLAKLKGFKDKQLIKVVTGIRRCGKSTLLELFKNYLVESGIESKNIIHVNLESPDFFDVDDYKKLYDKIKSQLSAEGKKYIFIDEVQNIPDFQKAVNALFIDPNNDLYITGSNAFLLSGELATLLSGRYVEIKMLPLSFKEYISAFEEMSDPALRYRNYIVHGSFPYCLQLKSDDERNSYYEGLYSSVLLKDVVARYRISDVLMLDSVIKYMFDNIGNLCSSTKIANTMSSAGRKISVRTVENYLEALSRSYVLYKAERYDIKGRQYLTSGVKYYLCDIGLRYYLLGNKPADIGHILENVVYLELLRRGYKVYIGKTGTLEIDFVAIGNEGTEYYQVAYTVIDSDGSTLSRELSLLESVRDHNPKYLLTMDYSPVVSHNGIKQINVLDWLMR